METVKESPPQPAIAEQAVPEKAVEPQEPAKSDPAEKPEKTRSFIESLRDIVFIASIYIFFAGFVYEYFYFRGFGIPLSALNVSVNTTLASSYSVFQDHPAVTSVLALVAIACAVGTTQFRMHLGAEMAAHLTRASAFTFGILLFPIAFGLAHDSADKRITELRDGTAGKLAYIFLRDPKPEAYDPGFVQSGKDGHISIVAESSDSIYVLHQRRDVPPPGATEALPGSKIMAFVYEIPKKDVQSVRIIIPGVAIPVDSLRP